MRLGLKVLQGINTRAYTTAMPAIFCVRQVAYSIGEQLDTASLRLTPASLANIRQGFKVLHWINTLFYITVMPATFCIRQGSYSKGEQLKAAPLR